MKVFFRGVYAILAMLIRYALGIVLAFVAFLSWFAIVFKQVLAAVKAGSSAQTKALSDTGSALNSTDDARAKALGFAQCARNVQPAG